MPGGDIYKINEEHKESNSNNMIRPTFILCGTCIEGLVLLKHLSFFELNSIESTESIEFVENYI